MECFSIQFYESIYHESKTPFECNYSTAGIIEEDYLDNKLHFFLKSMKNLSDDQCAQLNKDQEFFLRWFRDVEAISVSC